MQTPYDVSNGAIIFSFTTYLPAYLNASLQRGTLRDDYVPFSKDYFLYYSINGCDLAKYVTDEVLSMDLNELGAVENLPNDNVADNRVAKLHYFAVLSNLASATFLCELLEHITVVLETQEDSDYGYAVRRALWSLEGDVLEQDTCRSFGAIAQLMRRYEIHSMEIAPIAMFINEHIDSFSNGSCAIPRGELIEACTEELQNATEADREGESHVAGLVLAFGGEDGLNQLLTLAKSECYGDWVRIQAIRGLSAYCSYVHDGRLEDVLTDGFRFREEELYPSNLGIVGDNITLYEIRYVMDCTRIIRSQEQRRANLEYVLEVRDKHPDIFRYIGSELKEWVDDIGG
jgi:hypothetical protein